jgi:hypothetical protein
MPHVPIAFRLETVDIVLHTIRVPASIFFGLVKFAPQRVAFVLESIALGFQAAILGFEFVMIRLEVPQ